MYAASVNSIRRTLGAAAIGVTLFGAANASSAHAQERMASTELSDRAAYLEAQCAHIKNHADAAGCYAGKAVEYEKARAAAARERGATARQEAADAREQASEARERAAAANTEITCQDTLIDGVKSGRFKKPDVQAAYKNQPVGSASWCSALNKLTKG